MLTQGLPKIQRLLCLGAHSDDIELGAGGTILRLLREVPGVEVRWVVFSADAGRRVEARSSAESFLNAAASYETEVHRFPDSLFPTELRDIKATMQALRSEFEPDLILTHHLEDRHQDHRTLSEVTWQTFRNQLIWEYEIPKYEGDLREMNLLVELGPEDAKRKAAMLCQYFESQTGKPWFNQDNFLGLMRVRSMAAGARCSFAEAFYMRKLVL